MDRSTETLGVGYRPISFYEEDFVAPLASMEDLSVLMTPMSTPAPTPGTTPGTTPGHSPKTRARWSHRISSGYQFEPLPPINDEKILELPHETNGQTPETRIAKGRDQIFPLPKFPRSDRNLDECPCLCTEKTSPTSLCDKPRENVSTSNGSRQVGELNFRPLRSRQQYPSPDRYSSPAWIPQDASRRSKTEYSLLRPRDVKSSDESRPILEDSDYQFVKPRQVQFLSSPGNQRQKRVSSPKHRRSSSPSDATSRLRSPTPSRRSPEYSSLIRASAESNEPIMKPPSDRLNLIYLTLVLHGVGSLLAWNMFMTAKENIGENKKYMLTEYFVGYKLSKSYTGSDVPYATYFLQFIGIAAQLPNVVFNWINIFLNVGGNLTSRIVWTLLTEVLVFVATIILAMVDSSDWPALFFYLTFGCVVILNMANGIYQNTVFGLAAKLPFKYTGAVVLGSNLSGTIVALVNIFSLWFSPNPRTAAIYYFITAMFILLACFDTYFALPLNRFYRYYDYMYTKALEEKRKHQVVHAMPYGRIFKQCFPHCFNVFFIYFVTLTIFPAVYSDVRIFDEDFIISEKYFTAVTCFLTFHLFSVFGNMLPSKYTMFSPRWIFIPIILRLLFLPFFLLCNYHPTGLERLWPVLIPWDTAYWAGGALLGLTGGYLASLAMMYCPKSVEPEYSAVAGMFGGASIVTGIVTGLIFSHLMPILVSHPVFAFQIAGSDA